MLLGKPLLGSLLSMQNHLKNTFSYIHTQLGALINNRNLILSTLDKKWEGVVRILLTTWNSSRKRLTLREIASLLRLVSNLALTTQWRKFTFIALQHTVSLALKFNSNKVITNGKHKYLTDLLASKSINTKNFFLSRSHKTVWNSKEKFNITK